MANVTFARRYAQAALELGLQHDDLPAWRNDLAILAQVWSQPAERAYMEDVRVSKQARQERCRAILGPHIAPRTLNMVLLLISRGRTVLIPFIAQHFTDLERQRDETVIAHVTAAQPLTDDQHKALVRQLARKTGKDVQLDVSIEPSILGGLVIKVEDQLLDLSLIGKLNRMRDQVVGRRAS